MLRRRHVASLRLIQATEGMADEFRQDVSKVGDGACVVPEPPWGLTRRDHLRVELRVLGVLVVGSMLVAKRRGRQQEQESTDPARDGIEPPGAKRGVVGRFVKRGEEVHDEDAVHDGGRDRPDRTPQAPQRPGADSQKGRVRRRKREARCIAAFHESGQALLPDDSANDGRRPDHFVMDVGYSLHRALGFPYPRAVKPVDSRSSRNEHNTIVAGRSSGQPALFSRHDERVGAVRTVI